MKRLLSNPRIPALFSTALVAPFMILEFMFSTTSKLTPKYLLDSAVLFGLLWLLPFLFMTILLPVIRNRWQENPTPTHPIILILKTIALVLIAVVWAAIISDQLPCFLGIPDCD